MAALAAVLGATVSLATISASAVTVNLFRDLPAPLTDADAEARYAFGRPQSGFALSPDPYNRVSYFLGGIEVFDLNGTDLVPPKQLGLGAVYVRISDTSFEKARMSSSGDALDFTNIFSLAAIPIPASLPLLLGGLVGLRLLASRRKADQA